VFKEGVAVQDEPSYSSLFAKLSAPLKFNAAVCVPQPDVVPLAVFVFPPADQAAAVVTVVEKLYSSVADVIGGKFPPKAKAAEEVDPAPPNSRLAVAKLVVVVQLVPSYVSVAVD
jgi:hypothetical protein